MKPSTVFLIDDDESVCEALSLLVETAGYASVAYYSAEEFLAAWRPNDHGCLLLDMCMPGMNGAELQEEMLRRGIRLPIIFMSAFADVPTTVRVIQGGALDFLTKPVNGAVLIERIQRALTADESARLAEIARHDLRDRLEKLTFREREILCLAIAGKPNKEIAQLLDISHRTIEAHRSRILLKMGVHSLLALSSLAADAGVRIETFACGTPMPGQMPVSHPSEH
ncbi:MAG: response regulator transcription factor [Betaproteobacteria bacterium]|nr:response regulator transcription factor [Betaproteobacteria bacterium]